MSSSHIHNPRHHHVNNGNSSKQQQQWKKRSERRKHCAHAGCSDTACLSAHTLQCPPGARPSQTGPITIHCAAKLSMQCNHIFTKSHIDKAAGKSKQSYKPEMLFDCKRETECTASEVCNKLPLPDDEYMCEVTPLVMSLIFTIVSRWPRRWPFPFFVCTTGLSATSSTIS